MLASLDSELRSTYFSKLVPVGLFCSGTFDLKSKIHLHDATATTACVDEVSRERMIILTLHPPVPVSEPCSIDMDVLLEDQELDFPSTFPVLTCASGEQQCK